LRSRDATLFDRGDNVEAAWSLVDPILDVWSAAKTATVPQYSSGSWGPRSPTSCWNATAEMVQPIERFAPFNSI